MGRVMFEKGEGRGGIFVDGVPCFVCVVKSSRGENETLWTRNLMRMMEREGGVEMYVTRVKVLYALHMSMLRG